MRPAFGDLRGINQRDRNPAIKLEPGHEYGWLTAVKRSSGDKRFFVLRCRCGAQEIRQACKVLAGLKRGHVPACPECRDKANAKTQERP